MVPSNATSVPIGKRRPRANTNRANTNRANTNFVAKEPPGGDLGMRLPDAIVWTGARVNSALLVTRSVRDFPPGDPGVRMPYEI